MSTAFMAFENGTNTLSVGEMSGAICIKEASTADGAIFHLQNGVVLAYKSKYRG